LARAYRKCLREAAGRPARELEETNWTYAGGGWGGLRRSIERPHRSGSGLYASAQDGKLRKFFKKRRRERTRGGGVRGRGEQLSKLGLDTTNASPAFNHECGGTRQRRRKREEEYCGRNMVEERRKRRGDGGMSVPKGRRKRLDTWF